MDIFGVKVQVGDVVCCPTIHEKKQILTFAVVITNDEVNKRGLPILARPLDSDSLRAGIFRFKRNFYTEGSKMWVLKDLSMLPAGMAEKLRGAMADHRKQQQLLADNKARRELERDLTASERYERNTQVTMLGQDMFDQMQRDALSA